MKKRRPDDWEVKYAELDQSLQPPWRRHLWKRTYKQIQKLQRQQKAWKTHWIRKIIAARHPHPAYINAKIKKNFTLRRHRRIVDFLEYVAQAAWKYYGTPEWRRQIVGRTITVEALDKNEWVNRRRTPIIVPFDAPAIARGLRVSENTVWKIEEALEDQHIIERDQKKRGMKGRLLIVGSLHFHYEEISNETGVTEKNLPETDYEPPHRQGKWRGLGQPNFVFFWGPTQCNIRERLVQLNVGKKVVKNKSPSLQKIKVLQE